MSLARLRGPTAARAPFRPFAASQRYVRYWRLRRHGNYIAQPTWM